MTMSCGQSGSVRRPEASAGFRWSSWPWADHAADTKAAVSAQVGPLQHCRARGGMRVDWGPREGYITKRFTPKRLTGSMCCAAFRCPTGAVLQFVQAWYRMHLTQRAPWQSWLKAHGDGVESGADFSCAMFSRVCNDCRKRAESGFQVFAHRIQRYCTWLC